MKGDELIYMARYELVTVFEWSRGLGICKTFPLRGRSGLIYLNRE